MGTGERRRLIVLCSVAGLLVVVLLAKFVLFNGGGSGTSQPTFARPSITAGIGNGTTTSAPASRSTRTPATFDVFATKNPFEPVIIVTPPNGSTPTTGGSTPTTSGGGGGGGGGGATTTTALPTNEPGPGTSVALLAVTQQPDGTPSATVQVGSTVYTVGEGDVFATSYRVVSLDDPCGQFLFGDAPFRLCEGEEVIK
jgi:hypothetical protein